MENIKTKDLQFKCHMMALPVHIKNLENKLFEKMGESREKKKEEGFTTLEIIIVVAVIALIGLGITAFGEEVYNLFGKAKDYAVSLGGMFTK